MAKCIAVLVLMFGGLLFGQGNIQTTGAGAPSNPCPAGQEYVNTTNGDLYSCSGADNTWRLHGNRGSNISSGAFGGGTAGNSYQDVTEIVAPANPASGNERVYADSTAHTIKCLTSSGGSCLSAGGGSVAGSDKDVQINKSAAFGVDTGNFVFDYTNHRLGVLASASPDAPIKYGANAVSGFVGIGLTSAGAATGQNVNDANFASIRFPMAFIDGNTYSLTNGGANNVISGSFFSASTVSGAGFTKNEVFVDESQVSGSSTLPILQSFLSAPTVNTGSTITQRIAYECDGTLGSGSVGTNFCFYVPAASGYTFRQDSTSALNVFAGKVSIGALFAPGNALEINAVSGSANSFAVGSTGKVISNNGETTAGVGVAYERGATLEKAETGTADAAVVSVTPPAATGQYRINCNADVSAATSGVISFKVGYTDSNGTAQTLALPLIQLGTTSLNTTFTTSSAGNYVCWETPISINAGAAAISIQWVGGGTTTAKVSATIERLQ